MTINEIIKFTYWWCHNLKQSQIRVQLQLGSSMAVDWDMFCREICEIMVYDEAVPLGGPGKTVQIDESKIGKRKYNKGHRVEGQRVFGGIEEDSRNSFIIAVDKRDETTLMPLIKYWIKSGTKIVSDCWKAYSKIEENGYKHEEVNHWKEYLNKDGFHMNKIEGHWRQMKASLPTHGRRKFHYHYYLAGFLWRYKHRDEDPFWALLNDMKQVYDPNKHTKK